MTYYPVAEYRPDIASIHSRYTAKIKNVVPRVNGYGPFPQLDHFSTILSDYCKKSMNVLNAFAAQDLEGLTYHFIATETDIFLYRGADYPWINVSRQESCYRASKESPWSFAKFGDYIIAVQKNDKPQYFHLKKSRKFSNLKGNPPRAAIVSVWGDFLCLMQLENYPNRVHWSGLNDIEYWELGSKYCDYQDFNEGGKIQGSSNDKNPIIILENAIYHGVFLPGSDLIFNFKKLYSDCGAHNPQSIASYGNYTFFASKNGFFQITSDGVLLPIGFEKVDRTFSKYFQKNVVPNIQSIIDPFYHRVYWAFKEVHQKTYKNMLIYDWNLGKWSFIEVDAEFIFSGFSPFLSLKKWEENYKSLDNIPVSFDDPSVFHVMPVLSAFVSGRLAHYMSQTAETAYIYSEKLGSYDGGGVKVKNIRPLVDGEGVITVLQSASSTDKNEKDYEILHQKYKQNRSGITYFRAQEFIIKFTIFSQENQSWNLMTGFDLAIKISGKK